MQLPRVHVTDVLQINLGSTHALHSLSTAFLTIVSSAYLFRRSLASAAGERYHG